MNEVGLLPQVTCSNPSVQAAYLKFFAFQLVSVHRSSNDWTSLFSLLMFLEPLRTGESGDNSKSLSRFIVYRDRTLTLAAGFSLTHLLKSLHSPVNVSKYAQYSQGVA